MDPNFIKGKNGTSQAYIISIQQLNEYHNYIYLFSPLYYEKSLRHQSQAFLLSPNPDSQLLRSKVVILICF